MPHADKPTNSDCPKNGNSTEQLADTMNKLTDNWHEAMGNWSAMWNDNIQSAMDAMSEAIEGAAVICYGASLA